MDSKFEYDLILSDLWGKTGLSPTWGEFLCEASSYCFELSLNPKGVTMKVQGEYERSLTVYWEIDVTDEIRNSWNDEKELVEFGAYGIAILLILKLTGFTVIKRARIGTGVDYWLGWKDAEWPFENAARLEVSGMLREDNPNEIGKRVRKKLKQTTPTDGQIPALVVVVEFGAPISHLVKK